MGNGGIDGRIRVDGLTDGGSEWIGQDSRLQLEVLLRNRARKGSLCRRVNRRVKSIQRSRRFLVEEHPAQGLFYRYLGHSYNIFPPHSFLIIHSHGFGCGYPTSY